MGDFMLDFFRFLILGIIQGITEPIPVSSSGHLLIIHNLLNSSNNIDFNLLAIFTNFGSFIAIVIIFWDRIVSLFKDFFGFVKTKDKKYENNFSYCLCVILGTIPAGIMGIVVTKLGLFDFLEENVKFVGLMLLVTALFLFIIKDFKGVKDSKNITFKDALIIGLFQVIALIPGISRSGATIVGGMFRGLKRDVAFDFSFILYIPITIATMVIGVKDLMEASLSTGIMLCYLFSTFLAFVFTYFATKWFRSIVKNGKLIYFVIYCLIVGFSVLLFL